MSNPIRSAVRYAIAIAAATAGMSVTVHAQQAPAGANETIEDVIVTGSRMRRTQEEAAVPVEIITRDFIERSGKQNIADVLRSVGADNQGSIPTAFTGGFAAGSSAVSLRGLGVNSTLVLVNGRRMATYGLADDGSRTFVDLNTIPFEAVERVDVLKGGASAIYGSDAVGGVINVILREEFKGFGLSTDFGTSSADDGENYRISGTYGFGDLADDRFNIYTSVEAQRTERIKQSDRPWLGGDNLLSRGFFDNRQGGYAAGFGDFELDPPEPTPNPAYSAVTPYGTVRIPGGNAQQRYNLLPCPEINPANGVCLFDKIDYYEIQPRQDRVNVFAKGTFKFSDALQGYAELGWFHNKTYTIGTPGSVNDNGVFNPADPLNPVAPPHTATLPANHPDNPAGVNRTLSLLTTMFGGRDADINSDVARAIFGVKGDITGTWTFDAAAGYIKSDLYREQTGFVRFPVLQQALTNGTFRIDPRLNSPDLMAAISPTLRDHAENSITLVDASVTGELFDMPAGPVTLAVGAEWRNEESDTPPVPFTDTSEIVGLGYSAFTADRTIYATYFEAGIPIVDSLDLQLAYRYDHYSDYGHSTTPQATIKWSPVDQVAFRATYSEAFRAPGPTESGESSALGFTNIAIITIGDPSVKPETAKSYTAGVVFEPFSGSNISLDYFRIDRENEINQADQASIVGGLPTTGEELSRIPGAQPNSFLYYDDQGQLATISGPYQNIAETSTDGFDVDLRQRLQLGDLGELELRFLWTHVFSFEKTQPDGTVYEYVGTQGPYALSSAPGTPRNRGWLEGTWSREQLSLTARLNYTAGMRMIDHRGEELVEHGGPTWATTTFEGAYYNVDPNGVVCGVYNPDGSVPYGDCKTPAFYTVDLYGRYDLSENLTLSGSIANATNKHAPFNPYSYGAVNYNPAFTQAGAVGRFFSLGLRYSFQ